MKPFIPSSYYPEYFKLDLELGTEHEFPLSTCLDQISQIFLIKQLNQTSLIASDYAKISTKKKMLNHFGFRFAGFSDERLSLFYRLRSRLFELQGTFAAVDILASIHFDQFKSFKGLEFSKKRLLHHKLSSFRLSQLNDQMNWLTYQIPEDVDSTLKKDFIWNAKLFLPIDCELFIISKNITKKIVQKSGWNIKYPEKIGQRRI